MSAHNDSAFLRMFLMVLGALVAFTVIILILANAITGSIEEARGPDPRLRAIVAERIQPVGSVNVASAAAEPAAPKSGAEVVAAACNSCHGAGVLGAPKLGDTAAWEQRLNAAGGIDALTTSAINGKGAMPPKGGAMVSDDEIRAAVEHMLSESGVDVAAAATPAPAAQAAAEPAAEPAAASGPVEAVKQMADNAVDVTKSAVAAVAGMLPGAAPEAPVAEAPAAQVQAAPAAEADLANGKSVYASACFVCHTTGAAGAPKLGDKALWAPRIAQGMETLVHNAIAGKNAMPPKGGRMDLSDTAVADAVAYMVHEGQ
ncbi:MAG: cytochrome c5 family protein [Gammaproteobacteria bacterium]|nr:cytochrome c5 family protein [Gammaproteobacteria bacterium]